MVVASDGVFDVMTNQEIVDFIMLKMGQTEALNKICEDLLLKCTVPVNPFTGVGSDNMTVIVAVMR